MPLDEAGYRASRPRQRRAEPALRTITARIELALADAHEILVQDRCPRGGAARIDERPRVPVTEAPGRTEAAPRRHVSDLLGHDRGEGPATVVLQAQAYGATGPLARLDEAEVPDELCGHYARLYSLAQLSQRIFFFVLSLTPSRPMNSSIACGNIPSECG